jgi:hypothetical protein
VAFSISLQVSVDVMDFDADFFLHSVLRSSLMLFMEVPTSGLFCIWLEIIVLN